MLLTLTRSWTRRRIVGVALVIAVTVSWPVMGQRDRIIDVGPNEAYQVPSQAADVVEDGDTVRIAPGDYADCAHWRADDLHIIAPDGDVTVRDVTCEGKALWIISGDNVIVDGIVFTGAAVPDRNGAGIRAQGINLTVRNSAFIENENGILAGANPGSTLLVEYSEFVRNGFEHGIYANRIDRLVVRNSVFREHRIRHHIKSRALATEVIDSIIEDGDFGTSSYLIDVPNGGTVTITGNALQKGPNTDNARTAIGIGLEGDLHTSDGIWVEGNTFVNEGPWLAAFVNNRTETSATLRRNRLTGFVTPLSGPGELLP